MRRSLRISHFRKCVYSAFVLVAAAGQAVAGGFGIEQSAYYQGMSYAGAAAGGPSLASLAWNPATAVPKLNAFRLRLTETFVPGARPERPTLTVPLRKFWM